MNKYKEVRYYLVNLAASNLTDLQQAYNDAKECILKRRKVTGRSAVQGKFSHYGWSVEKEKWFIHTKAYERKLKKWGSKRWS